ncbi:MAG: hypothetical protein GY714_17890 [Desulfobacterales bacterium]|nr:hypothetical protein [Desulfobacterales bacterium]MCP4163292.1 hypothetical protein [Deltaproteobacteria bacterium]
MQVVTNPIQNFNKLMKGRFDFWYAGFPVVKAICKKRNVELEALYVTTRQIIYCLQQEHLRGSNQIMAKGLYKNFIKTELFTKYTMSAIYPTWNL